MSPSDILTEKEAILERLQAARHRNDMGEVRRRLGELQYFTRVKDDAYLKQTRLDWLDRRRIAIANDARIDAQVPRPFPQFGFAEM